MNISKTTALIALGIGMITVGILGLILCSLPAVSSPLGDLDSVWGVVFSDDADAYGGGQYALVVGLGALFGGCVDGLMVYLAALGKVPVVPKKLESASLEEKKKKVFLGAIAGGSMLFLLFVVAAVLFFNSKGLLGYEGTLFKAGSGAVSAGVVCLILAVLGVASEYILYLYRLKAISEKQENGLN